MFDNPVCSEMKSLLDISYRNCHDIFFININKNVNMILNLKTSQIKQ